MEKENEGYYAVAAFISIIITMLVHYFFIAGYVLHTTLHAAIGVGIFLILSALFSAVLSRLW